MKTLSSALSTEVAKAVGGAFRILVKITPPGGSTYYSSSEDRTISNAYLGTLINVGTLDDHIDSVSDMRLRIGDTSAARTAIALGAAVEVLLWPLDGAEGDADLVLDGVVHEPVNRAGGVIEFDVLGNAATHLRRRLGTLLDATTFSQAPQSSIGLILPFVFGSKPRVRAVAIDTGAVTLLAESLDVGGTEIKVTDSTAFPSSGTVQIDDENIAYTSNSGNVLGTLTRGDDGTNAANHKQGVTVFEVQTTYKYAIADHRIKSVDEVYVDGIRQVPDETTLDGAINASVTSLDVDSVAGFAPAGSVKIDDEWIDYASISSLTLQTLTRGVNGTTAASHSDAAAVEAQPWQIKDDTSGRAEIHFKAPPTVEKLPTIETSSTLALDDPEHAHDGSSGTMTATKGAIDGFDITSYGSGNDQLGISNDSNVRDGNLSTFATCDTDTSVSEGYATIAQTLSAATTGKTILSADITVKFEPGYNPYGIGFSQFQRLRINEVHFATVKQFYDDADNTIQKNIAFSNWADIEDLKVRWKPTPQNGLEEYLYEVTIDTIYYQGATEPEAATGITITGGVDLSGQSTGERVIGAVIECDVNGYNDDGSGTYTGVADSLIEQPDELVRAILVEFLGVPSGEASSGDFEAFTGEAVALSIEQIPLSAATLISELARQTRAIINYAGGRWYMKKRPADASTITTAGGDFDLDDDDVVRGEDGASTLVIGALGLEALVNTFRYRAGERFDGGWENADTLEDATSQSDYGEREETFEFPFLYDSTLASTVANYWADRLLDPDRNIITLTLGLAQYAAEVGDTVEFTSTVLPITIAGEIVGLRRSFSGGDAGKLELTIEAAP